LELASLDSEIVKTDATSLYGLTPGTDTDKRQLSNNTTLSSIYFSNGTFTNGSIAGLGPGIAELTASTTASNHTLRSRGNITGSTQQSDTRVSVGPKSEKTVSSSGSKNDGAKLLSINLFYHKDGKHDDPGDWICCSIERFIELFFDRTVQLASRPSKLPVRQ
jgi:hypothetical protein